ncbi:MAG TPA: MBL fold metallo-hydrolase [Solirubrobacteraceae bacterium]|jgi:glyoxylase-like metal-dependent hydrolase (beta-lactamase superfamily II)
MRAISHGDHLIQLERMRFSNCYLVREDDGLTLIDTSIVRSAGDIVKAAQDAGGGPIRRILVTHCHNDHVGSLDAVKERVPEAEVAMSAREAELMRGEVRRHPDEPDGRLRGFVFHEQKTKPDRLLSDGDMVGSLRTLWAPGHTPGHLAFLDTRDNTLIAGDAYLAIGNVFVTSEVTLRFPMPALVGMWHAGTSNETARRLRELEPSRLATGHGKVVDDPLPAMDHALAQVGSAA